MSLDHAQLVALAIEHMFREMGPAALRYAGAFASPSHHHLRLDKIVAPMGRGYHEDGIRLRLDLVSSSFGRMPKTPEDRLEEKLELMRRRAELAEEDAWCVHKWLDEQGAPRERDGMPLSIVGRITALFEARGTP